MLGWGLPPVGRFQLRPLVFRQPIHLRHCAVREALPAARERHVNRVLGVVVPVVHDEPVNRVLVEQPALDERGDECVGVAFPIAWAMTLLG